MLVTIEHVHPDPYAVVSRDSVRRLRDALLTEVPETTTRVAVWPAYARLVAALGDSHTNLYPPPEEIARYTANQGTIFPADLSLDEMGKLRVSSYWPDDSLIHRGDAITRVNGRPVDSLLHAFVDEISGESVASRRGTATEAFSTFLWYNGVRPPYTIEIQSSGDAATKRVVSDGITADGIRARRRRAQQVAVGPVAPNFTYRLLDDRVAYIDLFSLGGSVARFREDLDRTVAQAIADSARRLVVDLRRNGGGDSRLGEELLSHITTTPYRMSGAKMWKMSGEYRAFLKSRFRPPLNHLIGVLGRLHPIGRKLLSGPDGTIVTLPEAPESHPARAPQFDGPVCVLIGPRTFSSAADLADAIKTYRLATLIGEETGGRPNHFGEVYPFRTARTGFLVFVSSARYVGASGDTTNHDGVLPDIEVRRTAADIAQGRDAALDRARACAMP
jgi:C-terminal processing protease CtpA/Prc